MSVPPHTAKSTAPCANARPARSLQKHVRLRPEPRDRGQKHDAPIRVAQRSCVADAYGAYIQMVRPSTGSAAIPL